MLRWLVGGVLILGVVLAAMPAHASGTDEFAAIEEHTLAAPPAVATSPASLAAYLVEPAQDEREKAYAIFRWITANIAYDTAPDAACSDAQVILSRRSAVCSGYAVLFQALAEAAGLKAEIIIGHSKRFGAWPSQQLEERPNHAWNAVQIAGQWELVDCSWGAGYLDEGRRFVPRFSPHYFMTAPETFAYDHLPLDSRWQLLDPPVSTDEYLRRPQVRPPFFDCGLRLVSHHAAVIDAERSLTVVVGAPEEAVLAAALYREGEQLDDGCTFTQREADGFSIHARFPSAGAYVLRIFARRRDDPGCAYAWALDYAVQAHGGEEGDGFPKTYSPFLARNCHLEQGLSGALPAGGTVKLSLTVPSAEDVMVATGGSFQHLPAQGSRFAGEVPVSSGAVVIFARFAGATAYEGLLQYTGR